MSFKPPKYTPPQPAGKAIDPSTMPGDALDLTKRAQNGNLASLPGNVANSWLNMLPGAKK